MNILVSIVVIFELLFLGNLFASDAKSKVILSEKTIITGITAKTSVKITPQAIMKSISSNKMLRLYYVIRTCIFTNHEEGDFNITVTADDKFIKDNEFALHNETLGKVPIKLFIVSNGSKFKETTAIPNQAILLKDHSDPNASGMNCENLTRFRIGLEPETLRTAKAGTYGFAISLSVNNV
jgi:hypothetical protein